MNRTLLIPIERKTSCDVCRVNEMFAIGRSEEWTEELAGLTGTVREDAFFEAGAVTALALYFAAWIKRNPQYLGTCDRHHAMFSKFRTEMEKFHDAIKAGGTS